MKLKKRRSSKDLCIFIGLFLVIFVTIFHVLLFSHSRAVSLYDNNASARQNNLVGVHSNSRRSAFHEAEKIARNTLNENLTPASAEAPGAQTPKPYPQQPPTKPQVQAKIHNAPSRARMRALAQAELRKMEKSLTALVRQNAPSPEISANKYRSESSAFRLKKIIQQTEEKRSYNSGTNRTLRGILNVYNDTNSSVDGYDHNMADKQDSGYEILNEKQVPSVASGGFKASPELEQHLPGSKIDLTDLERAHHFKDIEGSEEYTLKETLVHSMEVTAKTDDTDRERLIGWNISRNSFIEETRDGIRTLCKEVPEGLEGVTRDVHLDIEVDIEEIIKTHQDIQPGGEWKPPACISRHRLAIIIPYRDRWNHLKVLLHYLLPLLKRQQIHFRIFVVEQYGNQTFNKGRIMNAAYREALKLFDFQCVTFHDVDLVPEDDRNIYTCAEHPKHMSTAIDKFNYHLPYQGLVGGVLSFRVDHFQLVNGYSNMYWGWGGEDDDMTTRILSKGLRIFRPPNNVARYKMVKHSGRSASQIRLKLLRTAARRGRVEGLNNVPYHILFTHMEKLFTHFMVDVGEP